MSQFFVASLGVIAIGRGVWIAAMPVNLTEQADLIRRDVLPGLLGDLLLETPTTVDDVEWYVEFGSAAIPVTFSAPSESSFRVKSFEVWDANAPVWIVAGFDAKPGRAGWDDDRNGFADDVSELGAAWSDDHGATSTDSQTDDPLQSRMIDRGAFVPQPHFEKGNTLMPLRLTVGKYP